MAERPALINTSFPLIILSPFKNELVQIGYWNDISRTCGNWKYLTMSTCMIQILIRYFINMETNKVFCIMFYNYE